MPKRIAPRSYARPRLRAAAREVRGHGGLDRLAEALAHAVAGVAQQRVPAVLRRVGQRQRDRTAVDERAREILAGGVPGAALGPGDLHVLKARVAQQTGELVAAPERPGGE